MIENNEHGKKLNELIDNSNQINNSNNNNSNIIVHDLFKGKNKPKGYWSKEKCFDEALKYETKREFQAKSSSAFVTCFKNKW